MYPLTNQWSVLLPVSTDSSPDPSWWPGPPGRGSWASPAEAEPRPCRAAGPGPGGVQWLDEWGGVLGPSDPCPGLRSALAGA